MELLAKPEMLTSDLYGPTFGKAEYRIFLRVEARNKISYFIASKSLHLVRCLLFSLEVQTLVASASTEKVTVWKNSEVK
jgi:hypothetical protein